jgi:hypothetical protein
MSHAHDDGGNDVRDAHGVRDLPFNVQRLIVA